MITLEYGPTERAVDAATALLFMLGSYLERDSAAIWMGKVALRLATKLGDGARLAHVHNALGTVYDSQLSIAEFGAEHLNVAGQ